MAQLKTSHTHPTNSGVELYPDIFVLTALMSQTEWTNTSSEGLNPRDSCTTSLTANNIK